MSAEPAAFRHDAAKAPKRRGGRSGTAAPRRPPAARRCGSRHARRRRASTPSPMTSRDDLGRADHCPHAGQRVLAALPDLVAAGAAVDLPEPVDEPAGQCDRQRDPARPGGASRIARPDRRIDEVSAPHSRPLLPMPPAIAEAKQHGALPAGIVVIDQRRHHRRRAVPHFEGDVERPPVAGARRPYAEARAALRRAAMRRRDTAGSGRPVAYAARRCRTPVSRRASPIALTSGPFTVVRLVHVP